jgi:hypothetical protein
MMLANNIAIEQMNMSILLEVINILIQFAKETKHSISQGYQFESVNLSEGVNLLLGDDNGVNMMDQHLILTKELTHILFSNQTYE